MMVVRRFQQPQSSMSQDPYPMSSIKMLIDGASVLCVFSFMDSYSRYNKIRMNPNDASKTTFMTNLNN